MYAVIRTGGKQYRVQEGDIFSVERLPGDEGSEIVFDDILAVGAGSDLAVGRPNVDGATVRAEILKQGRGKKILVFKFKRRKNYKRLKGHRQYFTRVRVTDIDAGSGKAASAPKKKSEAAPAEEEANAAEGGTLKMSAIPDEQE